jgi:hypothetical protein
MLVCPHLVYPPPRQNCSTNCAPFSPSFGVSTTRRATVVRPPSTLFWWIFAASSEESRTRPRRDSCRPLAPWRVPRSNSRRLRDRVPSETHLEPACLSTCIKSTLPMFSFLIYRNALADNCIPDRVPARAMAASWLSVVLPGGPNADPERCKGT